MVEPPYGLSSCNQSLFFNIQRLQFIPVPGCAVSYTVSPSNVAFIFAFIVSKLLLLRTGRRYMVRVKKMIAETAVKPSGILNPVLGAAMRIAAAPQILLGWLLPSDNPLKQRKFRNIILPECKGIFHLRRRKKPSDHDGCWKLKVIDC